MLRYGIIAWLSLVFILGLQIGAALPAHAEVASIYGGSDGYCGKRTASGAPFNCHAMTAAHRTLPFGTSVTVCHRGCVTVRINDRGPFVRGRDLDLSPAAARAIGCSGVCHITMGHVPRKGSWGM